MGPPPSQLRDKVGIAAVIGAHPFTDNDLAELLELLEKPYYEKIDGRPLVYFFGGMRAEFLVRLREACEKAEVINPYVVPMYNEYRPGGQDFSKIEALSAYANIAYGINSYDELAKDMIKKNQQRLDTGCSVIPLYTVGWDPSPRVDIPSPWVDYPDESYAPFASEDELMQGAVMLAKWITDEAKERFVGHILVFAWNEFEEGGYICPTFNEDCSVNLSRLEAFTKTTKYFKEKLSK